MSISAVSPSISSYVSNTSQTTPAPAPSKLSSTKDSDGDNDASAPTEARAAKPTVNTNGQTIGTKINITA